MKIKVDIQDIVIKYFSQICVVILSLTALYPILFIISVSISSPDAVLQQKVFLYPVGFSLDSYRTVLNNPELWRAFGNTVWYTAVGTALNIVMTVIGAYPLSRKNFFARSFFMVFILITMLFSGGIIPHFILINKLGLYDTRWAIVVPAAVSAWNIVMARVFFQTTIPDSLIEAAQIDGYNEPRILWKIVAPLSMPIIAIVGLFSAVGFWNSYFSALIYLSNPLLKPLQILLREVLIVNSEDLGSSDTSVLMDRLAYLSQVKYVVVIVSMFPIMCVYPFLQKYFVKGVMIGAIKE